MESTNRHAVGSGELKSNIRGGSMCDTHSSYRAYHHQKKKRKSRLRQMRLAGACGEIYSFTMQHEESAFVFELLPIAAGI
jgi:hypothetical protein